MRIVIVAVCRVVSILPASAFATSPLWGKIVFHSERDRNVEIYGDSAMRLSQTEESEGA